MILTLGDEIMKFDINHYLISKGFLSALNNPFLEGKTGTKISDTTYMWEYKNIKGFTIRLYYNIKTRNRNAEVILPDGRRYERLSFKKLKEIIDSEYENY